MGTPFIGETRIFSFNFVPKGWAGCNGQLLPINQNPALFSLLGTTYGGNGVTTFALPNLQGRAAGHVGTALFTTQGLQTGAESVTLSSAQMPSHNHFFQVSTTAATQDAPSASGTLAQVQAGRGQDEATSLFAVGTANAALGSASIGNTGGSQSHENRQPFLTLNYSIALQGIFPSRS